VFLIGQAVKKLGSDRFRYYAGQDHFAISGETRTIYPRASKGLPPLGYRTGIQRFCSARLHVFNNDE
jgi:hypothetical protein